ncbi:alpha/beta hydrolase [Thalassococcus sp. CAU 1522]|uniref:Alpha/beta hydrolase n=1 Tax=Thalassococcus arenae TaxID=2851652 RepID=A0ABS6N334_9RHOB|nr:alpha/beta hydrolase [Thalassococcus arenae]
MQAGDALAAFLAAIRRHAPARPIRLVAHSLGARVALRAIAQSRPNTVETAILLAAAEYAGLAEAALDDSGTRVLNVCSRENDVFDFLMELLIRAPRSGDRMIGHRPLGAAGCTTLQIDDPASLAAIARIGFPVAPPSRRVCHWSAYLRPGLFPLYRAVLDGTLSLSRLKAVLPSDAGPRWSLLRPNRPVSPRGLPAFPASR